MPLAGDKEQTSTQQENLEQAASNGKFVVDKAKQAGSLLKSNNEKSILNTNEKAANARLLSDKGEKKLRSHQGHSSLRQVNSVSQVTDKGGKTASQMERTEKKLQRKLRNRYTRDYTLKGGLNSPLRIESGMKSKLRTNTLKSVGGDSVHSALRFVKDKADQDSFGTQKALFDVADKTLTGANGVYKISRQAKHFRQMQKEKKIAKLLKSEDKIAKKAFKQEFKAAYAEFKNSPVGQQSSFLLKQKQKRLLKRKYMKNAMKQYQQAKKAGQAGRVAFNTGFSAADKIKNAFQTVVRFVKNSKIMIVVAGLAVLMMLPSILSVLMTFMSALLADNASNKNDTPSGGFPEQVEEWREFVVERCEANNDPKSKTDLTQFVNAILTTIWQESGGNPDSCSGDVMQCKACGLWDDSKMPSDWSEAQKSIDVGIRYFYGGLKNWNVTDPEDYDGLQIVAQGYNYGFAFLDWMRSKGATKWTLALSTEYSDAKATATGWSSYGHKPYGEEWLEKYMQGSSGGGGSGAVVQRKGVEGVVLTALNQEGITESDGDNNVIYNTDFYGREVHDGGGVEYPWCCAFVWWCFEKSGNGNLVPKTAGCSYMQSHISEYGGKILNDKSKAKRGDLVIFRNGSHIGIVVENKGNGNLKTIEGNTTPTPGSGNEYNGGCVALRDRNIVADNITAVLRPNYPDNE